MSVIPMKLFTIAGLQSQFDAVVRACIVNRAFHPENAMQHMKGVHGLRPFDLTNPYTALLRRGEQVADEAGIALEYASFDGEERTPDALGEYFDHLEARVKALLHRREAQIQMAADYRNYVSQLEHLKGVTANLEDLWAMEWSRFRYGHMPRETYESFRESLEDAKDFLFFPTNVEQKDVYGVYFTTKTLHSKVDSLFNSLRFTRIHVDAQAHGTAVEAMADMARRADEAQADAQAAARELDTLRADERDTLLSACSYLRYMNECYDLRRFAAHSKGTFYLMGWVPETSAQEMRALLAAFPEVSCVVDNATDVPDVKPPTKLKNSFLGRTFHPFLEMYGLPAYNELDPSLFMALTYCLFFGVMYGDVGQGLCLALVGFVMARFKKMWLGKILVLCGIGGTLFGFVYGSVFGLEDLLPGFKILAPLSQSAIPGLSNVLVLLVCSISVGVLMLVLVMVLNIVNGVRQHNFEKIFFGQNGLAGLVFYLGLIVAAVCTLLLGVNLFVPAYVLPVLVLPLLLILFKEPLAQMVAGDSAWKETQVGALLSIGFFELFETLLSYLTNTLSFLRVGAYAIVHVGLMLVVETLAHMAGATGSVGWILVMVAGNIFVMGFEGLLVCIQVLRLEFYELFGRFYDDGGAPFVPKRIDYASHTA